MELEVLNQNGSGDSKVSLAEGVFNQEFNQDLVHQLVNTYIFNSHQRTKGQKNRSAVRGGGKKPWKQKGTGRARAGTIRSPIWRGGGMTFAHTYRDLKPKKINKKMYRGALNCIFNELLKRGRLHSTDKLSFSDKKTKLGKALLDELKVVNALFITTLDNPNAFFSLRNIKNISVLDYREINPYVLMKHDNVVIDQNILEHIEKATLV